MKILGISCYYHDAAAVLIDDGKIIAAAEEERFSRKKHDSSFPKLATEFCLLKGKINISGVVLGKVLLPIYFFTLIAGARFGWRCGLIVGLVTPIVSNFISGMPMAPVLYFVIFKSVVLGVASGLLVNRENRTASFLDLVKIVFVYQALGSMFIFVFSHNLNMALMDVYIGWPGLIIQLIAGRVFLKMLNYEKENI